MNTQDYDMMKCLDLGIKDVIWIGNDESLIDILVSKEYFTESVNNLGDKLSHFFFRYEEDKDYYNSSIRPFIVNKDINPIHQKLGNMLGFPPKATQCFFKKFNNLGIYTKLSVNFCGMYFASYTESIKEDIDWLIQTKPLIDGEVIMIGNSYVTIGDNDWLDLLYKIVDQYKTQ